MQPPTDFAFDPLALTLVLGWYERDSGSFKQHDGLSEQDGESFDLHGGHLEPIGGALPGLPSR